MLSFRPSPRLSCRCTTALRCLISRIRLVVTVSSCRVPTWATSRSSCTTSPAACQVHSLVARRRPVSSSQRATRSNWRTQTGLLVVIRALSPALRAHKLITMPLLWSRAPLISAKIATCTLQLAIITQARRNSNK